jgi:dTDP-4-dehydrorhamnose reductase
VSGIIDSLNADQDFKIDASQIKHPLLLEDAADTLLRLLDYEAHGIYQANGAEGLNKVQMSRMIAEVMSEKGGKKFSRAILEDSSTDMSNKPKNTRMVNVDTPRSFEAGISYLLDEIEAAKAAAS